MTKTTGTIYEVPCPHCGGLIRHIHKLKRTEPKTSVRCRRCRGHSLIERLWVEDEIWPRVTLFSPDPEVSSAEESANA